MLVGPRIGPAVGAFVGPGANDGVTPTPNVAPTAEFSSEVDGLTVDFTDESDDSDGTIAHWHWNFGDGATSTSQNPSHDYAEAGTYTVTLTVTDNRNGIDSVQHDVEPEAPWTVDGSGIAMPVDSTEYTAFLAAASIGWAVPASLYLCQESSGNLTDTIGAVTFTAAGAGLNYESAITGWTVKGVSCDDNSGTQWWERASVNLSTTAMAVFVVCEINTLGSRNLFSMGGDAAGTSTEVNIDAAGHIVAKRGAATASSTGTYGSKVVGILAVCRPGSSDFSVYVSEVGGSLEALTPTWSAPNNAVETFYLGNGWIISSDAEFARVEVWTGADAQQDATAAADFFDARGF